MNEINLLENLAALATLKWPAVSLIVALIFKDPIKSAINSLINKHNGNSTNLEKKFLDLEKIFYSQQEKFLGLEQIANHQHSDEIRQLSADIRSVDERVTRVSERLGNLSNEVYRIKGKLGINGKD